MYILDLPSLCPADCFKKFCSNKRGILTEISLGFSDISSDISSLWAHESTSLDVNKANGMLYSNAKRIFCYNVTCFATKKSCSSRSHPSGCFKCSSLLACKAAKVHLSTCFPIILSFSCTPCIYPLCVLQTVFKKLCSNKRGKIFSLNWFGLKLQPAEAIGIRTSEDLSQKQVPLEMWCIWSRYE